MSIEKFLINKNIARNKKQAEGIMIAIIILCVLFIGFKLFKSDRGQVPELTQEELRLLESGELNLEELDAILLREPALDIE